MTLVEDRPRLTPQAGAESWLAEYAAALQAQDAAAAADLFLPDGLWRDLLAFTWTIETMAGRPAIAATLRRTLARTKPANFRIPPRRTPPRWVARAGSECIEAIFEFDTAFGPATAFSASCPTATGGCAPGRSTPICTNCAATKNNSSGAPNPTRRAISAPRTGPTVSPASAPLPTAIPRCWSSAAGRPGSRSRRGCSSSASTR